MAGMSQSRVSRLERARARWAPVAAYALLFAVLGRTLVIRTYPDASPARDAGHARVFRRFGSLLGVTISLRTEVPLKRSARVHAGDLRAWDGELAAGQDRCKVEVETILSDIQALDRRIGLKMEDDGVDRVILVVADTRRNREALRQHGALLRSRFPLSPRQVLADLRAGRLPARGGIVPV